MAKTKQVSKKQETKKKQHEQNVLVGQNTEVEAGRFSFVDKDLLDFAHEEVMRLKRKFDEHIKEITELRDTCVERVLKNSAESVSDEEDETLDCTLTELEPTTPTSETDARKNTQPLKSTASKGEVSTVESQKSKKPPVPPIGSHVKAGGRKRVSAEVEGSQLNMPFSAVSSSKKSKKPPKGSTRNIKKVQGSAGKVSKKSPKATNRGGRPTRQAASNASLRIRNYSKGRKGSTLMKAETSVIEIDEDTLDVSTEEAEVIVTVKKAKQNTSNRQGNGTPTSKEASSSEQKTETIVVENDEDGENEEKEIDVEGQEKKKKSKRGGDQCLRSGSGAKRDRASLKDRSDSSGDREASAKKQQLHKISSKKQRSERGEDVAAASEEVVSETRPKTRNMKSRSVRNSNRVKSKSKTSNVAQQDVDSNEEAMDETPVITLETVKSSGTTTKSNKPKRKKSKKSSSIHSHTDENSHPESSQKASNDMGQWGDRYQQVLKPLLTKQDKFFSKIIVKSASDLKTDKTETPEVQKPQEENVESPIVRSLRSKTPLVESNATFNVNKTVNRLTEDADAQKTFVTGKTKHSQVTFREPSRECFAEHGDMKRSGIFRPVSSMHQSDITSNGFNETGEVIGGTILNSLSRDDTPKRKFPVSPFIPNIMKKNNVLKACIEEDEDESEESNCEIYSAKTSCKGNYSQFSSPLVTSSQTNLIAANFQAKPPPVGGSKIVTSFHHKQFADNHNTSNAHNATRVNFMNNSRFMPSPLSKTVGGGVSKATPLMKKINPITSTLTGSGLSGFKSVPRSGGGHIVSNVKSFWNPDLNKQKLELHSKGQQQELKKAALEEKERKQQERLRQLEERKKQEQLEKKRQNEERALKAKLNMANMNPTAAAKPPTKASKPPASSSSSNQLTAAASNFKSTVALKLNNFASSSSSSSSSLASVGAGVVKAKGLPPSVLSSKPKTLPVPRLRHMYCKLTELVPDNDDDEEMETDDESRPKLPVPKWAKRKSIFLLQKNRRLVKKIRRLKFAYQQDVYLPSLFNVNKPRYMQRRSTAIWDPVVNAKPNDSISFIVD